MYNRAQIRVSPFTAVRWKLGLAEFSPKCKANSMGVPTPTARNWGGW
jgi:hypothetical protein